MSMLRSFSFKLLLWKTFSKIVVLKYGFGGFGDAGEVEGGNFPFSEKSDLKSIMEVIMR